ncbi:MAG: phosphomethylpyrimidine synthase, partial [Bacteroidales bacterium]|nr:phosphomethylpyrimidine synthase [Bacteroidales bacterium]
MNDNNKDICASFRNSEKIYVESDRFPIRVGMRRVQLTDSVIDGQRISNGSINLYDTSGVFTDPDVQIDIKKGLPRLREAWHKNDDNVEQLDAFTSEYTNRQLADESLKPFMFPVVNLPKRAVKGKAFTQMALARKGVVTPEMEYVAIRENMGRKD